MLVEINDISTMIENFIKASIKSEYPNSDLTGTSSVVDLFIKPMTSISEVLMDFSKDLELRSLLSNASDMSEEDLNDIGEGNYMVERAEGVKSFGTAILKFKTVPEERTLTIPIGAVFSTASGLKFKVHQTYSFSPEEVSMKWDSGDLSYNIEVSVEAESVGSQYNINAGELTKIDSSFSSHSVTVTNNTQFSGGTDKETNEEYKDRIIKFVSSRTLETAPGYESEIKDEFEEVSDVHVSGYGDELMTRDLVESVTIEGVTFTNKHIGGKVDLYIRGDNITNESFSITSLSKNLPLPETIEEIDQTSITVTNDDTSTVISDYSVAEDTGNDKVILTLNESSEWDYGDTFTIGYDVDTTGDAAYDTSKTESFTVDNIATVLKSPLEAVASITNETQDNTFYDVGDGLSGTSDYTLTYTDSDFAGSSNEEVYIEMTNTNINNGDTVTVVYNYNETINNLKKYFEERENRVVTRDVLFKKCIPAFFHVGFSIKLKDGISESSTIKNELFDVISQHFENKGLGEKIDESDIVHEVYSNENLNKTIDYIGVGFDTFHKTLSQTDLFNEGVSDGTTIELDSIQYPVLKYLNISYID